MSKAPAQGFASPSGRQLPSQARRPLCCLWVGGRGWRVGARSLLGAAARGLFGIRGLGWSRALLCPRDRRKQAGSHITPPLLVDNCPPQEGRCLAQGPATGRGRPRQVPWVPKRGRRPRAPPPPHLRPRHQPPHLRANPSGPLGPQGLVRPVSEQATRVAQQGRRRPPQAPARRALAKAGAFSLLRLIHPKTPTAQCNFGDPTTGPSPAWVRALGVW